MANALGTLFGDIANAIREKSGETGTMKPAQFPEMISGIKISSGGGDGTFPSQTFWVQNPEPTPYIAQTKRYFTYDGGSYMYTRISSSAESTTKGRRVYSVKNNVHTLVASFDDTSDRGISPIVEFNGMAHIFYDKKHYAWGGGSSLTSFTDLPYYYVAAAVMNNEFLVYCTDFSYAYLYKWDETTDTMELLGQHKYVATSGKMFVWNNELYFVYEGGLYQFQDYVPVLIKQMDLGSSAFYYRDHELLGDYLYAVAYPNITKLDMNTLVETVVSTNPIGPQRGYMFNDNGRMRLYNTVANYSAINCLLYEIE